MLTLSQNLLVAGTLLLVLGLLARVVAPAASRRAQRATAPRPRPARVGGPIDDGQGLGPEFAEPEAAEPEFAEPEAAEGPSPGRGLPWYASRLTQLSLAFVTAGLLARMAAVGHGPFANQYEFAVSFAWGILAGYVYVERRQRVSALALLVLPIALAMLLYAATVGAEVDPLVPALQNHLLLTLHVLTAVLAYGAAAVAFGAAVLYLLRPHLSGRGLPAAAKMEDLGHRAVVVSFPLMTMTILLGAIWADLAWGTYWSWDPKETASLVTWLIYGAYLHARDVRGWRGRRSSWLLVLGFAAVLFTYFGNLFLGGMHSYA